MQEKDIIKNKKSKCKNERCFYTWIHLTITSILILILIYFGAQFFVPKTSKLNKIYLNQTLAVPNDAVPVNNEVKTVLVIYDLIDYENIDVGEMVIVKRKLSSGDTPWVYEYNGVDGDNILVMDSKTTWIEAYSKEDVIGVFKNNSNGVHKMYYMATIWFGYLLLFLFFASLYTLSRFYILQPLENKLNKEKDIERIVEERIKIIESSNQYIKPKTTIKIIPRYTGTNKIILVSKSKRE